MREIKCTVKVPSLEIVSPTYLHIGKYWQEMDLFHFFKKIDFVCTARCLVI